VQNFNEQINILIMVAVYTALLTLKMPINAIITLFALIVASLMLVIMRWSQRNIRRDPTLLSKIGQEGHGTAL
jgi:membrane protein implicated in regulation of membrane protease activity